MVKGNAVLSAFVAGTVFGFGLCLSHMVDPSVVVGFADVTGEWDPRLLFVMAGALMVTGVTFPLILKKCNAPVCDQKFVLPEKKSLDKPLVLGAVIFGIGWGLGGVCPGPAVTALAFGLPAAFIFLAAMAVGMVVFDKWSKA